MVAFTKKQENYDIKFWCKIFAGFIPLWILCERISSLCQIFFKDLGAWVMGEIVSWVIARCVWPILWHSRWIQIILNFKWPRLCDCVRHAHWDQNVCKEFIKKIAECVHYAPISNNTQQSSCRPSPPRILLATIAPPTKAPTVALERAFVDFVTLPAASRQRNRKSLGILLSPWVALSETRRCPDILAMMMATVLRLAVL